MSVLVTIACLAYNHEKYLRRTLEGFLMQKTDFPFEARINEDVSTDHTADILREYEAKYPDVIKPVYQTVNQYSREDVHITRDILLPLSDGKYVALCEGDDDWTDPLKLQRQIDFLESHPEYSMCVHAAYRHVEGTDEREDTVYPLLSEDRDYSLDEIIRNGAGLFATNSFVIRRDAYENPPECFAMREMGDYTTLMYAALCGKVRCLKEPMSRHNEGVAGSWTEKVWNDPERHIAHQDAMIALLNKVDKYYEGRYHDAFAEAIRAREQNRDEVKYRLLIAEGRTAEAKSGPYRAFWKRDRKAARREALKKAFPFLLRLKRRLTGGKEQS